MSSSPIRLIPAIDLIDGKCVRLSQGDYQTKKVYSEDPIKVAQAFQKAGIRYLHAVDLDGAKAGKVVNTEVIKRLCSETDLHIDFGGGIRTTEDVRKVLSYGVKQITAGSIAVKQPDQVKDWIMEFGQEAIIIGADLKAGKVAIHGWEKSSDKGWQEFLNFYMEAGARYFVCTDIARDGMLTGPAHGLYGEIIATFPEIKLVASGGIANLDDIKHLQKEGLDGAIFGKAFYEGRISLEDLREMIKTNTGC